MFFFNNDVEVKDGVKMQVIPTDKSPSLFWITNPNNTFTNCAAVGGKFGYPKNIIFIIYCYF